MNWTVIERRGDVPPARRGDEWREVVTFDVMTPGECHPVATLFHSGHGAALDVVRERARLMAAAPALSAAAELAVRASTAQEVDEAREALIAALLSAHGDRAVYA